MATSVASSMVKVNTQDFTSTRRPLDVKWLALCAIKWTSNCDFLWMPKFQTPTVHVDFRWKSFLLAKQYATNLFFFSSGSHL